MSRKWLVSLLVLAVAALGINTSVSAQNSGDIIVDPVFQEVVIQPRPNTQYSDFKITNNTGSEQTFNLRAVDFGSLNETGGVAFIGINNPDSGYKYGLSPWFNPQQSAVNLAAGETKEIKVKISDIKSMTPGGHYGAILVEPQNTNPGGEDSKVALSQVISSLFLVKKVGGEIYNLELVSSDVSSSAFRFPSSASLKFHNGGNVHLVPRGTVVVRNSSGNIISEGLINNGSGFILPESNRQLYVGLQKRANAWLPGKYYVDINYRYDGNDEFKTKTLEVYYAGKIVLFLPIIFVVFALVFWLIRKRK